MAEDVNLILVLGLIRKYVARLDSNPLNAYIIHKM
jgi:hypothetical protein